MLNGMQIGTKKDIKHNNGETMKNLFGKSRPKENPYATYKLGDWEWRVLKTYQRKDKEDTNQYSRWFVAVRTPMTHGGWDMGDTYINDIMEHKPELTQATDEWKETYE